MENLFTNLPIECLSYLEKKGVVDINNLEKYNRNWWNGMTEKERIDFLDNSGYSDIFEVYFLIEALKDKRDLQDF